MVAYKKVNPKLALYATGVTLFPVAVLFFLPLLLGIGKLLLLTPALLFVGGYLTGGLYDLLA
jgi:hypothetical protein